MENLLADLDDNADLKETEDWKVFLEIFRCTALFYGYNDQQARQALKACLREDAARAVQDINPNQPNLTFDQLVELYEERFMPAAQSATAQAIFDNARQDPKESILQWHARARTLFLRAYPNDDAQNSTQLIRKFVLGLKRLNLSYQNL